MSASALLKHDTHTHIRIDFINIPYEVSRRACNTASGRGRGRDQKRGIFQPRHLSRNGADDICPANDNFIKLSRVLKAFKKCLLI